MTYWHLLSSPSAQAGDPSIPERVESSRDHKQVRHRRARPACVPNPARRGRRGHLRLAVYGLTWMPGSRPGMATGVWRDDVGISNQPTLRDGADRANSIPALYRRRLEGREAGSTTDFAIRFQLAIHIEYTYHCLFRRAEVVFSRS